MIAKLLQWNGPLLMELKINNIPEFISWNKKNFKFYYASDKGYLVYSELK